MAVCLKDIDVKRCTTKNISQEIACICNLCLQRKTREWGAMITSSTKYSIIPMGAGNVHGQHIACTESIFLFSGDTFIKRFWEKYVFPYMYIYIFPSAFIVQIASCFLKFWSHVSRACQIFWGRKLQIWWFLYYL